MATIEILLTKILKSESTKMVGECGEQDEQTPSHNQVRDRHRGW